MRPEVVVLMALAYGGERLPATAAVGGARVRQQLEAGGGGSGGVHLNHSTIPQRTPATHNTLPPPHPHHTHTHTTTVLFFSMGDVWLPGRPAFCALLIWASALLVAEVARWVRGQGEGERRRDRGTAIRFGRGGGCSGGHRMQRAARQAAAAAAGEQTW